MYIKILSKCRGCLRNQPSLTVYLLVLCSEFAEVILVLITCSWLKKS